MKYPLMEDIVVLETKIAKPDCEVFKLIFATGEFCNVDGIHYVNVEEYLRNL